MFLAEGRPRGFLDDLDLDAADVAFDPFVEDGAKEFAPGLRPDRLGADAVRASGRLSTRGRNVTNEAPISLKKP